MGKEIEVLAIHTFTSPLVRSFSWGSQELGTYESTMELIRGAQGHLYIEWDIPDLEKTEYIGLEFDQAGEKIVTGYDGIMDMPKEAIKFLEAQGYNCDEIK